MGDHNDANVDPESAASTSMMPNGKTSAASPPLGEDISMEEEQETDKSGYKLPLHEDIMQLARLGEIGSIQTLLETGKCNANYKDEESITPLHWAAINNHFALCKFLIESGADVNARGGESVATPAMWAVQKCHLYVVHLLLQNGADPNLTDAQGYTMLHLATFDGNVYQLLILLHQSIPVDSPDPSGHTCLMWAAYKGYPACVDLLLQWGASVNVKDEKGFTALHWALVKGNALCIHKLVECGSDRFAETDDGKTPAVVAFEMESRGPWHRALRELGFNSDGTIKQLPLPNTSFIKTRTFHNRFFFLCPFVLLLVVFSILTRAQTMWESMRGNTRHTSRASEAITSTLVAGSTSMDGAQISDTGVGPNPTVTGSHQPHRPRKDFFGQWKKLLGLDTFVATASGKTTKRRNPFSRGVVGNCKDFWCDPAPYFRRRANGAAMLGGDIVNYASMYETPSRMKMRRPRDDEGGGLYHSIGSNDAV
ncbi:MAG: hypothetical protein Q9217_001342 [Psora testacea]